MVDDSSRASGAAAPPADLTTPEARQQAGSGLAGTGYLTLVHVLPEPLRSQMLADPALSDPALSDPALSDEQRFTQMRQAVGREISAMAGAATAVCEPTPAVASIPDSDAFLTVATARLFAAFVGGGKGRLRPTLAGPVKPAAAPALSDDERNERLKSLLEASRERRSAKPDAEGAGIGYLAMVYSLPEPLRSQMLVSEEAKTGNPTCLRSRDVWVCPLRAPRRPRRASSLPRASCPWSGIRCPPPFPGA